MAEPSLNADSSTLDEHASVLRAYADQQKAHAARLREELREIEERVKRSEKAIAALQPESVSEAEPGTRKRRGSPSASTTANWTPSEKLVARVLADLEKHGTGENGITINRLAEKTGVAGESVRRALEALRERGEARFLGVRTFPTKNGRTMKAKAYKAMPTSKPVNDELSRASEALIGSLNGNG